MPELPEVETIVRDLRPGLVGAQVTRVELNFPSMVKWPDPAAFIAGLEGRTITAVRRRAKYILIGLDSGSSLVIHLGMSGTLVRAEPGEERRPHLHLVVHLADGSELRFRDPRRFGRILLGRFSRLRNRGLVPALGPEPLGQSFSGAGLDRVLQRYRRPLKAVLLDQGLVAGLGNIYADEACHLAGLRPDRPASEVSPGEALRLQRAIRRTLRRGIANRGSTVDQYRDGRGQPGSNQERLQVYGRGGQACYRCGQTLAQVQLAGRTTVFCPGCQA